MHARQEVGVQPKALAAAAVAVVARPGFQRAVYVAGAHACDPSERGGAAPVEWQTRVVGERYA